jgi:hypothetical protein
MRLFRPVLAVLFAVSWAVSAPYMAVVLKTGTRTETDLSQVAKVTFSTHSVVVHLPNGQTLASPFSDIQHIHFGVRTVGHIAQNARGARQLSFTSEGLRFNLTQAARIELDLYNLKGEKVLPLLDTHLPAGEHQIFLPPSASADLQGQLYVVQAHVDGKKSLNLSATWIR